MATTWTAPGLLDLAVKLDQAKRAEDAAHVARVRIEEEIIAHLNFEDGRETFTGGDERGSCKIEVERPLYHKVDAEVWERVRKSLPAPLRKTLMRTKYELALKEAKRLADEDNATWLIAAEAVTSTPGKVSVKLSNLTFSEDAT